MIHYIDKDAALAEIERWTDELYDLLPDASKVENGSITISEACNTGKYTALESFRRFINSLEVKEVDLDEEISKYIALNICPSEDIVRSIAKHFFELGKQYRGE